MCRQSLGCNPTVQYMKGSELILKRDHTRSQDLDPYTFVPYTQTSFKRVTKVNMKAESLELLEENTGVSLGSID